MIPSSATPLPSPEVTGNYSFIVTQTLNRKREQQESAKICCQLLITIMVTHNYFLKKCFPHYYSVITLLMESYMKIVSQHM